MQMTEVKDLFMECFDEQKFMKEMGMKFAKPVIMEIKAKIESGAIDPIKNTDLDKMAMLKMIDALVAAI